MTQRIKQFRYFGNGDPRNYPLGLTAGRENNSNAAPGLGDSDFMSTLFDRTNTTITYLKISCPFCLKVWLEMKSNGSVCEYQVADSGLLELKGIYCSNFWFEKSKLRNFSSYFRDDVYIGGAREEFADPYLIIDVYYEES